MSTTWQFVAVKSSEIERRLVDIQVEKIELGKMEQTELVGMEQTEIVAVVVGIDFETVLDMDFGSCKGFGIDWDTGNFETDSLNCLGNSSWDRTA